MNLDIVRGDCFEVTKDWKECVDLIIADPPYGGILDNDWDNTPCYTELDSLISRVLKPGGTAYVWGGVGKYRNRPFFKWLSNLEDCRGLLQIHNLITWSKKRAYGKKDNYLFTREECVMLVKGEKPSVFNIPLLETKRGYAGYNKKYPAKSEYLRRTNVWTDVTELFQGKIHPAEKPSKLAEIMIETSSNEWDLVLDPFAGSGSTGVACQKLNRDCILIEKSDCEMRVK